MQYVAYLTAGIIYTVAGSFLIKGVRLIFRPVFIDPVGYLRIQGDDDKNLEIYLIFFIFTFLSLLASNLIAKGFQIASGNGIEFNILEIDITNIIMGVISAIFITSVLSGILASAILFLLYILQRIILMDFKMRRSIRPLHCSKCRNKLTKLRTSKVFLTEKERIALQIGSINFESWFCRQCFSGETRSSVHLRAYVNTSDKYRFCDDCEEVTMLKQKSRIIKEPTEEETGRCLITYVCRYCDDVEDEIKIIPVISDGGGGDGGE